jgi:hypothetical protein
MYHFIRNPSKPRNQTQVYPARAHLNRTHDQWDYFFCLGGVAQSVACLVSNLSAPNLKVQLPLHAHAINEHHPSNTFLGLYVNEVVDPMTEQSFQHAIGDGEP